MDCNEDIAITLFKSFLKTIADVSYFKSCTPDGISQAAVKDQSIFLLMVGNAILANTKPNQPDPDTPSARFNDFLRYLGSDLWSTDEGAKQYKYEQFIEYIKVREAELENGRQHLKYTPGGQEI